ncbi:chlorophyllase/cutinase-like alpha/beta fold protein [Paenibacillus sp. WLX1005]|uniref:poly(ethylene terephthalate) hydrolase family protein n=1 Tax=Paenibacillus sp. WLX1005 TaxID=3243766 RepID=UPI003983F34D
MKKITKIIGISLLALVILVIAGGAFIVYKFTTAKPEIMTPENYETTVSTGGPIEKKYLAHGNHKTIYFEQEANEIWKKYEIYYPSDLENSSKKYPVIVMANGSGVWGSRYIASFEHYASWGFIVIGNEHNTEFAGDSSDASLSYLIKANTDPSSVLYQKVDLENVGIVGHSQGGVGVFNAITVQPHAAMYKTAISISPVGEDTATALNWSYSADKIVIPIMVVAGTENDVITLEDFKKLYSHISSDKVMGRRSNTNHPEMLYSADGYVTAWFMWQLQGDKEAAKAFNGNSAEILQNSLYQDVQININ